MVFYPWGLKKNLLWKISNIHKNEENDIMNPSTYVSISFSYQHMASCVSWDSHLLQYFKGNSRFHIISSINT